MDIEFICPITLCEFSHPVVISCGHTFEKNAIENIIIKNEEKSKCPICKENICGYITNWILVQTLNLDIKNGIENIELQNEIEKKIKKRAKNMTRIEIAAIKLSMERNFAAREEEIRKNEREKIAKKAGHMTQKIGRSTRINDHDYSSIRPSY